MAIGNDIKESRFRRPIVHFVEMGASSLDFVLRIWLTNPKDFLVVQDFANTEIYKRFTAENIEIPYAKQEVYLHPMGALNINGDQKG